MAFLLYTKVNDEKAHFGVLSTQHVVSVLIGVNGLHVYSLLMVKVAAQLFGE